MIDTLSIVLTVVLLISIIANIVQYLEKDTLRRKSKELQLTKSALDYVCRKVAKEYNVALRPLINEAINDFKKGLK
jgi:hypothetical protein